MSKPKIDPLIRAQVEHGIWWINVYPNSYMVDLLHSTPEEAMAHCVSTEPRSKLVQVRLAVLKVE